MCFSLHLAILVLHLVGSDAHLAIDHKLSWKCHKPDLDWNVDYDDFEAAIKDLERNMSTPNLIQHWGYPVDSFDVRTRDGYILELHHILGGRHEHGKHKKGKPAVFMQHGLLDSSFTWVANLPHQSAGFIFADAGFDVWLGNVRGNTYGRNGVDIHNDKFWNFSWDDMAKYDLPDMIDAVLEKTGQKNLTYIGHSQGTLIMFAKLAEDKEFALKINKFLALAPVSTVAHIKGVASILSLPSRSILSKLTRPLSYLFEHSSWLRALSGEVCAIPLINKGCGKFATWVAGPDASGQMNRTRMPVYVSHVPAGTSAKNIRHWIQMINSKKMQKFEYSTDEENLKHYGQREAPVYDISKIATETHLFYSEKDWLATYQDIKESIVRKTNPKFFKEHILQDFNHFDFVWGRRAADEIYKPIIRMLRPAIRI
ncbi:hypothetical protein L596_025768 [Steinernema carpocapsae]|uniref:Lipase n=1 Tax=Steinernema carpocapsae TaxID=34508 RepID=A0A4U5M8U6_STECR|nr:hypothetical protein L596_025768 [Steinernema carpocapsae]